MAPSAGSLAAAFVNAATGSYRALVTAVAGAAVRLGLRRGSGSSRRTVRLDDVRRRLELLVSAVYDRPIPITATEEPSRGWWPGWSGALQRPRAPGRAALAATDGEKIQLPRQLEAGDAGEALARYRLLAIEQAERIVRGTTALVPGVASAIERDLYLVREGAAIDAAIARAVPGLARPLAAMRADALAARPPLGAMSPVERVVEELVRGSLAEEVTSRPKGGASGVGTFGSPHESLAWAQAEARRLEAAGGRYRGVAPVAAWGTVRLPRSDRAAPAEHADAPPTLRGSKYGLQRIGRGSGAGGKQASERGTEQGTTDDPRRGVPEPNESRRRAAEGRHERHGPSGVTAGARDGTASPDRATSEAVAAEELADDRAAPPSRPDDVAARVAAQAGRRPTSRVPAPRPVPDGIEYPEWDWESGDYRPAGAVIRLREAEVIDERWGATVLARHGAIVRRLRERFERLRARRARLTQQRDGDELDLAACVRALVDQRSGHAADDRLYIAVRPARRGLAIALLIDISGSTDEWVDARRRVIDVEKVALLLASEALDALGDLYAILTFSGKGRANVRIRTIKGFAEANGPAVRGKIGALEPEGYTRAGAAIRHATALLQQTPAAHRLLLILSDGKPNDVDGYEGLSGVEDTRLAIIEARRQGVYPFCLTIDRQGQEYLSRIFGEAGHTILRAPQQLPMALVKVVRHLLAS